MLSHRSARPRPPESAACSTIRSILTSAVMDREVTTMTVRSNLGFAMNSRFVALTVCGAKHGAPRNIRYRRFGLNENF